MEHLGFSQIVDIAEGRSAPDAAADRHLAECAVCCGDLAWIKGVIDLMRDAAAEETPAATLALVKALFRRRPTVSGAPRLIQARLQFDSAGAAPAFGLRSGGTSDRQLLLSAGAYEIDLRIIPAHGRWAVSGQLLGYTGPGGSAELMGVADLVRGEINQLHEFALAPVRVGRYNLTLSLGEQIIVVPGLEIGG